MNYYSFHIGDYASHTRHLSHLEDLAYRRLIDAYYLSEKPFKGSTAEISKEIGMAAEIEEVTYVLNKFFESTEGGWINKRCDEEILKYHGKQEQAIRAGKASAEKRLNARSTAVQPTNNQEPRTKNQEPINKIQAPEGVSIQVWEDFVSQRKKMRAVISENVIKTIQKEALKAGWSLEQALSECAARGWRGFKAEWVGDKKPTQKQNGNAAYARLAFGLGGNDAKQIA